MKKQKNNICSFDIKLARSIYRDITEKQMPAICEAKMKKDFLGCKNNKGNWNYIIYGAIREMILDRINTFLILYTEDRDIIKGILDDRLEDGFCECGYEDCDCDEGSDDEDECDISGYQNWR